MSDLQMIGLHINSLQENHITAAGRLRGGTHIVLDCPAGGVARIKAASPGSRVIVRPFLRDQDVHAWYLNGNPREAGRQAARHCLAQAGLNPGADGFVLLNEPPCDSVEQVARQAEFDIGFMEEMHSNGKRGCIGAFSLGNPKIASDDGGAMLRAYAPALRRAVELDAWLIVHTYWVALPARGGTTAFGNGWVHDPRYFAMRWDDIIFPWLKANGIPIPNYVRTEVGFDAGGAFPFGYPRDKSVGWKTERPYGYGDDEQGARAYAADILWHTQKWATDPKCLGMCLYAAGSNGDPKWFSFLLDGFLLDLLSGMAFPKIGTAQAPAPAPTPGPSTPPTPPTTPPVQFPASQYPHTAQLVTILKRVFGSKFVDMRGDVTRHRSKKPLRFDVTKCVGYAIHHPGAESTWQGIASWHVYGTSENKPDEWAVVAYAIGIEDGKVYLLRNIEEVGNHVWGMNDKLLAVCVMGDLTKRNPSAADIAAVDGVVRALDELLGRTPAVKGHNDWALPGHGTSCPGPMLTAWARNFSRSTAHNRVFWEKVVFFAEKMVQLVEVAATNEPSNRVVLNEVRTFLLNDWVAEAIREREKAA
jgi:hypothetical protein